MPRHYEYTLVAAAAAAAIVVEVVVVVVIVVVIVAVVAAAAAAAAVVVISTILTTTTITITKMMITFTVVYLAPKLCLFLTWPAEVRASNAGPPRHGSRGGCHSQRVVGPHQAVLNILYCKNIIIFVTFIYILIYTLNVNCILLKGFNTFCYFFLYLDLYSYS